MFQLIFKKQETESWSYSFPPTTDPDEDLVSLTVDVKQATFISVSPTSISITDLADEEVLAGTYPIAVFLSDGQDTETFSITVVIKPAVVIVIPDEVPLEEEPLPEPEQEEQESTASDSTGETNLVEASAST